MGTASSRNTQNPDHRVVNILSKSKRKHADDGSLHGRQGSPGGRNQQQALDADAQSSPTLPRAAPVAESNCSRGGSTQLEQWAAKKQALVSKPEQLLEDLDIKEVLGTGGYGCVFLGFWRGTTPCAVKITRSPARDLPCGASTLDNLMGSDPTDVRARALVLDKLTQPMLGEAVLGKALAHPHIITFYDARCTMLTRDFHTAVTMAAAAARSPLPSVPTHASKPGTAAPTAAGAARNSSQRSGQQPSDTLHVQRSSATTLGRASHILATYNGRTPLAASKQGEKHPVTHDSVPSSWGQDAWDAHGMGAKLSWAELLQMLRAGPGDVLTVVIMQHAAMGTLCHAIQSGVFSTSSTDTSFTPRMRTRALICTFREVVMGVEHLHAHSIIHGDIKPANCLLVDSRADKRGFKAVVSDFGLSRPTQHSNEPTDVTYGTLKYIAPEVLRKPCVSKKADIYALGITLWEMASGQNAFGGNTAGTILEHVMVHGMRPKWPSTAPQCLKHVYEWCTAPDPAARPTAAELVQALSGVEAQIRRPTTACTPHASEPQGPTQDGGRAAATHATIPEPPAVHQEAQGVVVAEGAPQETARLMPRRPAPPVVQPVAAPLVVGARASPAAAHMVRGACGGQQAPLSPQLACAPPHQRLQLFLEQHHQQQQEQLGLLEQPVQAQLMVKNESPLKGSAKAEPVSDATCKSGHIHVLSC